ncbi:hypothetical protein PT276_08215 [Orbaceae bacterium ESL0721]|nr:hypothetical protein [Orbaceae bacterium ESL0721]
MKIDKKSLFSGILSGIVAPSMVNAATSQMPRNIYLSSYKRVSKRISNDDSQMSQDFRAVGNDMYKAMKYYG